jgi:hypothetical protein
MNMDELIFDIRATFPGVIAESRQSCTGGMHWMIGGEQHVELPDGLSVFCDCYGCIENGTHDGGVHLGFAAWLESRGFYLEREDSFWFVPTALPTEEQKAEWARQDAEAYAKHILFNLGRPVGDGLPF